MITKISLDNFKCLNGRTFEFNKLNILSGYNGRGKSSVLQSLLMLSQSVKPDLNKLHLNGEMINLGGFDEILTDDKKDFVGFNISTDDSQYGKIDLGYSLSSKDYSVGELKKCVINDRDYFDTASEMPNISGITEIIPSEKTLRQSFPESILKMLSGIHYISADRRGPVKFEERIEVPEFHRVMPYGNNAINTIESYTDSIPSSMNIDKADTEVRSLKQLASEWLGHIMDGAALKVNADKRDPIIRMNFNVGKGSTRDFSSFNVGFGYSYILSIIITALIAKEDSIVIIENPEAHLHGRAQSRLTELLSKLASRGVQVFVETHSEHIVNGFRLEMLRDKCDLSNEDASIYFFDLDFSIKRLKVEADGRILGWPDGFFNQETHDLGELMRLGAKVKAKSHK